MRIEDDEIRVARDWRNPPLSPMGMVMVIAMGITLGGVALGIIGHIYTRIQIETTFSELSKIKLPHWEVQAPSFTPKHSETAECRAWKQVLEADPKLRHQFQSRAINECRR